MDYYCSHYGASMPCPEVPRMGGLYSVLGTFLRCLHNDPAASLELLTRPKLTDGLGFYYKRKRKKKGAGGGIQYSVSRHGFLKSEPKVAVLRHLNYCEDSSNPQPGVPCGKSNGYCTEYCRGSYWHDRIGTKRGCRPPLRKNTILRVLMWRRFTVLITCSKFTSRDRCGEAS